MQCWENVCVCKFDMWPCTIHVKTNLDYGVQQNSVVILICYSHVQVVRYISLLELCACWMDQFTCNFRVPSCKKIKGVKKF